MFDLGDSDLESLTANIFIDVKGNTVMWTELKNISEIRLHSQKLAQVFFYAVNCNISTRAEL